MEGISCGTNHSRNPFLPRDRGDLVILVPLIQGQALKIKHLFNFAKKTTATFGLILEDTGCLPRYINLCLIGNFNVTTKNKKNYDSYVLDCCSDIVPFTTEIVNGILKKQFFREFSTIVLKIF